MAQWPTTPSWTEEENINNGQQYVPADGLTNVDLNNLIINLLYLRSQIGTLQDSKAYHYRGSLQTYAQLLAITNPEQGDVYNIVEADHSRDILAGSNFAWNGTSWDSLGGTFDMDGFLTTSDIINILTSTDTKKPLSAAQGKVLNDKFADYVPRMSDKDRSWNRAYGMDTKGNVKVYRLSSTTPFSETIAYRGPDKKIIAHDSTADNKSYYVSSKELASAIDELKYQAITIESFYIESIVWYFGNVANEKTVSGNTLEVGQIPIRVKCVWTTSTTPTSQTLNGLNIDISVNNKDVNASSDDTYTLKVIDSKDASDSRSIEIYRYPGVYYGASTIPSPYTGIFFSQLTKKLAGKNLNEIQVDAASDEYIFYCIPTTFKAPTFKVDGLEGGFELVKTISYQNNYGVTMDYNIYKSNRPSLGYVDVKIYE